MKDEKAFSQLKTNIKKVVSRPLILDNQKNIIDSENENADDK